MVGQTVKLSLPTPEVKPENGEESPDELESNTYLIGKITYELSPANGYGEVTMQCIKESFEKKIEDYEPTFNVDNSEPQRFDKYGNEVFDERSFSDSKFDYGIG